MIDFAGENAANRLAERMLYILVMGIIPFFVILFLHLNNPESPVFNFIATKAKDLPALWSIKNPLFSKVMDVYTKTSPLLAFVFLLTSCRMMRIKEITDDMELIKVILNIFVCCILSFILFYVFLCCNIELSTTGRLQNVITINEYTLTFFYITIYSGIYFLASPLLCVIVGIYRLLRER